MPISNHMDKEHFFVKRRHITAATPLFVALVVIEVMDVIFAIDSVPAILAITSDPFLVFSSNIFAILGLRSLYFFLSGMLDKFKYIKFALVFVLMFVGCKMIFHHQLTFLKEHSWVSLVVILTALVSGVIASMISNRKEERNSID